MFSLFQKNRLPTNAPSFLIIGAQKAGTTTLFDILNCQENFSGSTFKEVGFFSKDIFYAQGLDYYHSNFENNNKITFEATPEYLYYDFIPQRIYKYNKNMKFIILLREPTSRAYSAWNMFKSFNKNNPQAIYNTYTQYANINLREPIKALLFSENFPSFRTSVEQELHNGLSNSDMLEPSFVKRGLYYLQISRYLKFFKKENILFLEQRELFDQHDIVKKVSDFLKIKCIDNISTDTFIQSNKGEYDEYMNEDIEALKDLKKIYAPYNEKLFDLIGRRFDWNDQ